MRCSRSAVLGGTLALVASVAVSLAPAQAAAGVTYLSLLRFPGAEPGHAVYGPDAVLEGAVRPTSPDLVDFAGRGVIDVGTSPALNPGDQDFDFGAVIRLTRGAGDWNVMQKGYWSDRGQWKLSLDTTPTGLRFSCRVKGTAGALMVYSPVGSADVGGAWVRVECRREAKQLSILVNGEVVGRASGAAGVVANDAPFLIGSKGLDARDPDQFRGLVDEVWVRG